MKYSLFNNYVKFEDNIIVFNSYSMRFLYLRPELVELMNNYIPEQMEYIHPEFYSVLKENGFVCDNNKDEFIEAVNMMKTINNDKKSYRLIINPTTNCNFSCWYCYEKHSYANKMNVQTKQRICTYIEQTMANSDLEHFQLSFFGGEPLLYYSDIMIPIAQFAYNCASKYGKNYSMDITSNAYLFTVEKFDCLKKLGLKSCQITLDGCKEFHNQTRYPQKGIDSYSSIIKNIHIAIELGINIVLRINYTKKNLADIHLILQDFEDLPYEKRKQIILSMNKVWQETNTGLADEVNQFIDSSREFGFTIPDAFGADHVRNSCYADKTNEAVINFDGKVYKCNARDFTEERHEGILDEKGNIIWNELHNRRNEVRTANKKCRNCSIFPICGGGCSQVALDNAGTDYCIGKDNIEETIKQMFLSKYCIKKETL